MTGRGMEIAYLDALFKEISRGKLFRGSSLHVCPYGRGSLSATVIYNCIRVISMAEEREVIPVSLPKGLVKEIDELVERKIFSSRSEALRYGARLVVLFEKGIHRLAEDYAYEMIKERLERRRENVS